MDGIRKKFFFQLLYAFSQIAFPLVTYPYITRTLGAAGLGAIGYIEYVSGFIITIASFGIPFFGVREVARRQNDLQKKKAVLHQLTSLHLLASVIGCVVFLVLIKLNGKQVVPFSLLLLGCANILLPVFIADWYMQGTEAFVFTTVRSLLLRLAGLLALFVFVSRQEDYIIYYLVIVAVQAAIAITNFWRYGGLHVNFSVEQLKKTTRRLNHFFLTTSLISIYVFFDVLILGYVAPADHVGYYTIAIKIVKLSLLFVLSLNVVLFPRISFLSSSEASEAISVLIKKASSFIIVITIPMFIVFFFSATNIIRLLAGTSFLPAVLLVQILSGLPLIIGFSNLAVYQVLLPFGREKKLLQVVAVTCIVSLGMHLVMATLYKEKGTAIATVLTELLVAVLTGYHAQKTFKINFPLTALYQSVVSMLPFIGITYLLAQNAVKPLPALLSAAIVGGTVYCFLLLKLFKNTTAVEVQKTISVWLKMSASHE